MKELLVIITPIQYDCIQHECMPAAFYIQRAAGRTHRGERE